MFKIILLVFVVLLGGVLSYAALQPDAFRVERSTRIQAPPDKVFGLINDLQAFRRWSPYELKDPAMKRSFSGPQSGPGAHYAWEGGREIGQGSMTITHATPDSQVAMDLDFIKPFEAHNKVEFTLAADGDETRVTWAIFGPAPFMSKLMGLLFDMDKMVGADFEAGLARLKASAEAA